jgi:hypothetical protein
LSTKIANSKLGPMKFPKHEGAPNSEVTTYRLPPEEIHSRYGLSPTDILTREKFEEMRAKGMNYRQMAEAVGLNHKVVKHVASKYLMKERGDDLISKEVIKEVPVAPKEPLEISKENYDKLKNEGLTNRQIAERFDVKQPTLYYNLKKWKDEEQVISEQPVQEEAPSVAVIAPEPKEPQTKVAKGHFERIGEEIGKLVDEKQAAYGDSFSKCGQFLQLLYPNGIQPDQYTDALAQVRIFDKQMRIATNKNAFGESPFEDICGYALLGTMKHRKERNHR